MNIPTIVVVHKIKNRIRFKLSHSLRNIKLVENEFVNREGIKKFIYNDMTKSIVVEYNSELIKEEELIMRIIVMYSKNYGLTNIRLVYNSKKKSVPPMAYYSLLTFLIGGISKYIHMNKKMLEFVNWSVVGTTIGAIVEHASREINEKGYFDPEVVSVMYLINSVGKGKFLIPSMITWFATFGRHILGMSYRRNIIEVRKFKNKNLEDYYDIIVNPDIDTSKKSSIVKVFLEKFVETEEKRVNKSFIISNNKVLKSEGRFIGGFGSTFINIDKNSMNAYKNAIN